MYLFLAPGTVVRAAAGTTNFSYEGFAAGAGGALFAKDFEILGKVSDVTITVYKMLEGGATNFDRFVHDVTCGFDEQFSLFISK